MKKYLLFITISASMLITNQTSPCPHEFCPEDQRPFFEQYETENRTVTTQEKEEKS